MVAETSGVSTTVTPAPETTPQLQQTLDLLKDKLAGCGLANIPLKHSRSLCMSLTGKEPGPTILLPNMAGSPLMDRDTDAST